MNEQKETTVLGERGILSVTIVDLDMQVSQVGIYFYRYAGVAQLEHTFVYCKENTSTADNYGA